MSDAIATSAPTPADLDEFLWLVIVGFFLGFVYAFGIGANDVANSFASTVASGSLSLKQAIIVAGIFEFLGSILLGASVTSTIRSGIFDVDLYEDQPEILMLGFTTSIFTASFMLLFATFFGMPVSTTHTVVGTLMGFSIAAKGFDSIEWDTANKIFVSWIVSPCVAGIISFTFFTLVRYFILNHENAFQRAYFAFPVVIIVALGIDLYFIFYKGFNNFDFTDELPLITALPIAFGIGAICAIFWLYPIGPHVKAKIEAANVAKAEAMAKVEEEREAAEKKAEAIAAGELVEEDKGEEVEEVAEEKSLWQKFADNTYNQDLKAQSLEEEAKAAELWEEHQHFDDDAEHLFTYVQVFTACLNAFAHGANDVANAIGPLSGLLMIYQDGELSSKADVQKWILAYGGIGIVLGCLIFGYRVMKSLGYKVTALSPSRGACAELASSLFVVTASFLSIPVSSTQSITGAVTGVGVASGLSSVNWWFFARVCVSWVVIFFCAVLGSAMMFSMFAYSPSLV